MEAVAKALELTALRAKAQSQIGIAKLVEDDVRLNNPLPALEIATTAQVAETRQVAEAAFTKAEAEARAPLDLATAKYQQAVGLAATKKAAAIQQAEQQKTDKVAAERRVQELRAATAKAEIHTAQQNVVNIQTTMDNYFRQVKQQLGIDLAVLTNVSS
jgi:hypothetical protein